MSPGATFERIYYGLKEQLGSGRFAAGEQLEPATLAADLNASITPVRDALHRLAGEGLVEAPRGDGFRTPLLTENALRNLYRWNETLLDLAARSSSGRPRIDTGDAAAGSGPLAGTEQLFLAVAGLSGNPEHVYSVARANERLRPVRHLEFDLLPDNDIEIETMAAQLGAEAKGELRRSIASYHRRRQKLAADIVERLHRPR